MSMLQEGRYLEVGGIKTHYHAAGDGPAVILLHGSAPGVSAWANWQHTMPALAENFRVLALEYVGFGRTERPAGIRYGVRTWTDQVIRFADALDLETFSLVGNSMGGRISLQIAREAPERLHRMVLMGTKIGNDPISPELRSIREYEPSMENMRRMISDCFAFDASGVSEELVLARHELSVEPGAHEAYHAMFHDPQHADELLPISVEDVRGIPTPTLVVHGREDKVIEVASAWNLLMSLPYAELHVFSRCGHWTQREYADEFNTLVTRFLTRSTELVDGFVSTG